MIKLQHNRDQVSSTQDPQGDLLHFLREQCSDASVRFGCGSGHCGACTVLIDGQAQNACTTPVWSGEGKHIQTAKGLPEDEVGRIVWLLLSKSKRLNALIASAAFWSASRGC